MSKIFKNLNKRKIILFLLAVLMILTVIPSFGNLGVSAAVTGITYYEHNFELPLFGATGTLVKNMNGISAGTPFTVLSEQGGDLRVRLQNGTETTVGKTFAMINLPDVVPSIKYNITNSYSSVFKTLDNNIPGITGTSLYQRGTSVKNNPRLGKNEFIVPVLFNTAVKIAAAQRAALSDGYTLIVYEAYRPMYAQERIYNAYSPIVASQGTAVTGGWDSSWFIASGKSNHQEGYAIDVSLGKVTDSSIVTLSNPVFKRAELTIEESGMFTPVHELSYHSRIFTSPVAIYSDTAWQSGTPSASFAASEPAQRLQKYMTDAGFAPLSSEWWHFNDVAARNSLGNLNDITGNWELTANVSILPAPAASGGGTILISSDDYNYSAGVVSYPRVIHLAGGSTRCPGHISPGDNITTSNGYYIDERGNKVFAFCIDSNLPGAGETAGGQYYVNLTEQITDPFIIAALRLSNRPDVNNILFPGQSFSEPPARTV